MALRRKGRATPGEVFPGFSDVSEIGTGSLATVYRAREVDTNRQVALKLLNVRDASPRALESFQRESIALGALSAHPNIVTLFRTFPVADGRPVLVLELCAYAVSDRLRGGAHLPVQEAVSIAIKIAGALETAHRAEILHRDVKPQNILVTEFGEPALADFGVAMLQSSTQTTAGLFDFTTLHAAPELLEGGATSAATDVYELASTLYQLLVGQSAFRSYDGESPASVILRILRDPVAPVVAADVPVALSDLLIWAMSKDKEHRPPTAAEFAVELSAIEVEQGWPRTQFLIRNSAIGAPQMITRLPDRPGHPAAPHAPAMPGSAPQLPEPVPVVVPPGPIPEPVWSHQTWSDSGRSDPTWSDATWSERRADVPAVPTPTPLPVPAQPDVSPAATLAPVLPGPAVPVPAVPESAVPGPGVPEPSGPAPSGPVPGAAEPATQPAMAATPPTRNADPGGPESAWAPPVQFGAAVGPPPSPPVGTAPSASVPYPLRPPRPPLPVPSLPGRAAWTAPAPPRRMPEPPEPPSESRRELPPGAPIADEPVTVLSWPETSWPDPHRSRVAAVPLDPGPAAPPPPSHVSYPIPPAALAPADEEHSASDQAAAALRWPRSPERSRPFGGEMVIDPMSLRPRLRLHAGLSALRVDERRLTLRVRTKRRRIPWTDVLGFESRAATVDDDGVQSANLVALTTRGTVDLPATGGSLAEVRYAHAMLDAYRIRAQLAQNR